MKEPKLPKKINHHFIIKYQENIAQNSKFLIEELGFKLEEALVISDKRIWQKYRSFFGKDFSNNVAKTLILNAPQAEEKFVKKIIDQFKNLKLIIAIGSGTISDLAKYSAFLTKKNYIIFPTAPSMNGFASINASITINNHKKTLGAQLPLAIFCDLKILKKAPKKMIKAGISDAICLYSCWFDWQFSNLVFNSKFNPKTIEMQQKLWDKFFKIYKNYRINDQQLLRELMEILITSGMAMTLANGSYPASQSEHLIAHCLTMKYPEKLKNFLHGQLIAITTQKSLELQKNILLNLKENKLVLTKTNKNWQNQLTSFFGKKIAKESFKEYLNKDFNQNKINKINQHISNNHHIIFNNLKPIVEHHKLISNVLNHFAISTNFSSLNISKKQFLEAIYFAKFIRNRFTCLDFFKNRE